MNPSSSPSSRLVASSRLGQANRCSESWEGHTLNLVRPPLPSADDRALFRLHRHNFAPRPLHMSVPICNAFHPNRRCTCAPQWAQHKNERNRCIRHFSSGNQEKKENSIKRLRSGNRCGECHPLDATRIILEAQPHHWPLDHRRSGCSMPRRGQCLSRGSVGGWHGDSWATQMREHLPLTGSGLLQVAKEAVSIRFITGMQLFLHSQRAQTEWSQHEQGSSSWCRAVTPSKQRCLE